MKYPSNPEPSMHLLIEPNIALLILAIIFAILGIFLAIVLILIAIILPISVTFLAFKINARSISVSPYLSYLQLWLIYYLTFSLVYPSRFSGNVLANPRQKNLIITTRPS